MPPKKEKPPYGPPASAVRGRGKSPRRQVAFTLTHEALAKLARDLTA